jgi:transposase
VVLDKLSVHTGERARQAIEAKGCQVLFLPAYSPDFNPIEEAKSCAESVAAPRRSAHARGA